MIAIALNAPFPVLDFEEQQLADTSTVATLQKLRSVVDDARRQAASDWAAALDASLNGISEECSSPDWDGYGARPVTAQTMAMVRQLGLAMQKRVPPGTPAPDVVPENDGELSLTWDVSPGRLFSVSVGESGSLNFAGLIRDGDELHGTARLDERNHKVLEPLAAAVGGLYEPRGARS